MLQEYYKGSFKGLSITVQGFRAFGVPYFGVLIVRILLFFGYYIRVPYSRKPSVEKVIPNKVPCCAQEIGDRIYSPLFKFCRGSSSGLSSRQGTDTF